MVAAKRWACWTSARACCKPPTSFLTVRHSRGFFQPCPVCSYALGVLDKRAGVLRLAPAAGAGLVRLEPRVRGYDYGAAPGAAPAAALDREARIEQNKRCARARYPWRTP